MTPDPDLPEPAALRPDAGREAPAPRRRRWPIVVGAVLLLLVLAVLLAPTVLAAIARGRVIALAHERLDATATLGDLSIGFGGDVQARDLSLTDRQGQPILALAALDVHADVLGALSGRYAADVALRGLVLHVRRLPDGRLNLEGLARDVGDGDLSAVRRASGGKPAGASIAAPAAGDAPRAGAAGEVLPPLTAHVRLDDATILLHAPDGRQTELRGLTFTLDLTDVRQPAPFALDAQLVGPAGPAGTLHAGGTVTVARDGRFDPAQLAATLEYTLGDLLLAALQPALDTLAAGQVHALSGRLAGTGSWDVPALNAVNGRTELRLDALHLESPALAGAPLDLPATTLSATAAMDDAGTGTQKLDVHAGELLAVRWDGTTTRVATPDGALGGRLEVDADVGEVLALVGPHLALKPGVKVDGKLELRAETQATLLADQLSGVTLTSAFRIADMVARDARGVTLSSDDLPPIVGGLDGTVDLARGDLTLSRLQLEAGPVQAVAHGSATGLPLAGAAFDPAQLSIADSELLLDADLDRLGRALAPYVALPEGGLGGLIHVRATAATEGRRVRATTEVALTGLRLPDPAVGPMDLTLAQAGLLDLSPGGRSELTTLTLRSEALELDGSGAFTDLLDLARRKGELQATLRLRPGRASALLAGPLQGLVAEGQDVTVAQTVQLDGPKVAVVAQVRVPQLTAHGGAVGADPLALSGLALDADVTLDTLAQALDLRSLKLQSGPVRAAGTDLPALELTAQGRWDGARGELDVPQFAVSSALLSGGGRVHVTHLGAADRGPSVEADVALQGDAEAARAFAAAFSPELAAARAQGRWELSLKAQTSGTVTHAVPKLALSGVTLDGYVLHGEALPLRDVAATLDADLELDSAGAGLATLKSLALTAPGLKLTAEGRATGFQAPAIGGAASATAAGASSAGPGKAPAGGNSGAAPAGGGSGSTPVSPAGASSGATAAGPLPPALDASLQTTFTLQPQELSTRLAAFLGGIALEGETLGGQFTAGAKAGALTARGALSSPALVLHLPADPERGREAATLEQRDLKVDLDLTADLTPGRDSLALRTVRYASRTAQASVSGTLSGVTQPDTASADVTLTVRTQLEQLLSDVGALVAPGWSGRGALAVDGTLKGGAGQLALTSRTTIDDLFLKVPRPAPSAEDGATADGGGAAKGGAAANGGTGANGGSAAGGAGAAAAGAPLLIADDHVQIDLVADIASGPLDVALQKLQIASSFLSGSMEGRLYGLRALTPPEAVADASGAPGSAPGNAPGSAAGTAPGAGPGVAKAAPPVTAADGTPLVARAEGLKGDFTWIPAQVGALLGPLLPMQISGDQPQPLAFTLDGPLHRGDTVALLSGLDGTTRAGLGTLGFPGITMSGLADVVLADGRAHATGTFALNGGSANLDALLDLRPATGSASAATSGGAAAPGAAGAPVSHLKLQATGVQITKELGGLLASVHPLLAFDQDDTVAVASGAFGADLDLAWNGPLPLGGAEAVSAAAVHAVPGGAAGGATSHGGAASGDVASSEPAPPDLKLLSGTAGVDFGTVTLASSPLLGEMLGNLGLGTTQQFAIQPVKLAVQDGRVAYAEPWTWTVKDIATTFTGSVGMDKTLDLAWNVPITDALVAKHGFLKHLKGQSLAIPIRGTTSDPELQWTAALENLASNAVQNELEEKLKEKLGGLGGLIGGADKGGAAGAPGGEAGGGQAGAQAAVTPESLLAQADALWEKGSKEEAKPLYKQLKNDFKLTPTYLFNKKRIDERAKWKP